MFHWKSHDIFQLWNWNGNSKKPDRKCLQIPSQGKNFHSQLWENSIESLLVHKHSLNFSQDCLRASIFCSSKNVFHQFWMGVKCFLGVCLNDHVLRFYFFRQGNWLDCYFFSRYVILLTYEYMYCKLMTGKKIMERIKMQNVEMLKPWSIIKWDASGIHAVLTQRSWAMIYGFSHNYYCCRFFFSCLFSAAFLFLSSHLRFFLWTRFGGSLHIVSQSENKAC